MSLESIYLSLSSAGLTGGVFLFLLLLRKKTAELTLDTVSGGELEPDDDVVDPVDERLLAR